MFVDGLILASTSPYRRQQLTQFGLSFDVQSPDVEEVCLAGETPVQFALRMAETKAQAVSLLYPCAWVIGADQVCEFDGRIVRKPGNHQNAVEQLASFSGKKVLFHSALSVMREDQKNTSNTLTAVTFKKLSIAQIEGYLNKDKPYDCAGSFKVESQGLRLMQSVESHDPSALIGMPLIALCHGLSALAYPDV